MNRESDIFFLYEFWKYFYFFSQKYRSRGNTRPHLHLKFWYLLFARPWFANCIAVVDIIVFMVSYTLQTVDCFLNIKCYSVRPSQTPTPSFYLGLTTICYDLAFSSKLQCIWINIFKLYKLVAWFSKKSNFGLLFEVRAVKNEPKLRLTL